MTVPIDEHIRDQIVAESRGNPLALLSFLGTDRPRACRRIRIAGCAQGFGTHRRELRASPRHFAEQTRRLLLIAAADPTGDPICCGVAAQVGLGVDAAVPAVSDGLAEFGIRVRFAIVWSARRPIGRHPLTKDSWCTERRLKRPIRYRPRPPCVASRPGGPGTGRGCRCRVGALGRPRAGTRRPVRCGGVSRAGDHVHARTRTTDAACARRRRQPWCKRVRSTARWKCWPWPRCDADRFRRRPRRPDPGPARLCHRARQRRPADC